MIKKKSEQILKQLIPNYNEEDRKWLNVYNELQYRTDAVFEAVVSFYCAGVFLMHLDLLKRNIHSNRILEPLRLKQFIFNSYLYIEINNLVDPKGNSSITKFINFWKQDVSKNGTEFMRIFGTDTDIGRLLNHFNKFQKWFESNNEVLKEFKYSRDKNFSHIDHDFEYNNLIDYKDIIESVTFISDFLTSLNAIINMNSYVIINGEPVAKNIFLKQSISIDILRDRLQEEIKVLINNYYKKFYKNIKTITLNCNDSIDETLKLLKLIDIKNY